MENEDHEEETEGMSKRAKAKVSITDEKWSYTHKAVDEIPALKRKFVTKANELLDSFMASGDDRWELTFTEAKNGDELRAIVDSIRRSAKKKELEVAVVKRELKVYLEKK